jgi:hypothetical protein
LEVYRALYSVIVGLGSHDMDVINENQELTFNMNSYPIISKLKLKIKYLPASEWNIVSFQSKETPK